MLYIQWFICVVPEMASKQDSPGGDDLADIDFSVIRTSIDMGRSMLNQILLGVHYGSKVFYHLT